MPTQIFTVGQELTAFAYEDVTVATVSIGFTEATYSPATFGKAHRAYCTVETAQIRFTYNGTAPTTTLGHIAEVGDVIDISGTDNVAAFRAIRTGATSGTLRVTFERHRLGA